MRPWALSEVPHLLGPIVCLGSVGRAHAWRRQPGLGKQLKGAGSYLWTGLLSLMSEESVPEGLGLDSAKCLGLNLDSSTYQLGNLRQVT